MLAGVLTTEEVPCRLHLQVGEWYLQAFEIVRFALVWAGGFGPCFAQLGVAVRQIGSMRGMCVLCVSNGGVV